MQHLQHPASPATTDWPVGDSSQASVLLERRASTVASSERVVTLVDARFPSGRAQVLAWDVVLQGQQDLSTWLCRSTSGDYFLLCRTALRPTMPAEIVPLSSARAATWFDAHPARFASRDMTCCTEPPASAPLPSRTVTRSIPAAQVVDTDTNAG